MGPREFLSRSRVVIVAGKGGVGKTTVTAALGLMAVEARMSPLLVDVGGGQGLASAFGEAEPLTDEERVVAPGVRARAVNPDATLVEYLDDRGLARLARRLVRSGALDMLATSTPGVKDILVLSRIKQLERDAAADVIIIDAPATGHAITFLLAAGNLLKAVSSGPLHSQASEVQDMLADPARCRAMLVTRAEETPVNELVESAFALEDAVGVHLTPVVVNALESPVLEPPGDIGGLAASEGVALGAGEAEAMTAALAYRRDRRSRQDVQLERLAAELALGQIRLPVIPTISMGLAGLEMLAATLSRALETNR